MPALMHATHKAGETPALRNECSGATRHSPDRGTVLGYDERWGKDVGSKQKILKAIEELPEDAGVEDALDRLYLMYKIERGLRQADNGELISQEEVLKRFWNLEIGS